MADAPPPPPMADMLAKLASYVEGEAEMSIEDYRLLHGMNMAAAERYSGMAEYSVGLVSFAERLQSKSDELLPQLAQVWAQVGLPTLPAELTQCPVLPPRPCRSMCLRPRWASSKERSSSWTIIPGDSRASSTHCCSPEAFSKLAKYYNRAHHF